MSRYSPVARAAIERVDAAYEQAEQARNAEHRAHARQLEQAEVLRRQRHYEAAAAIQQARTAVEEADYAFTDAVLASRAHGVASETDVEAAWTARDCARRELRACEIMLDHWSPRL